MSLATDARITPARRQYLELKAQYPTDTVLLYRLVSISQPWYTGRRYGTCLPTI